MSRDVVPRLKPGLGKARPLRAASCRAHPSGWGLRRSAGFTLLELLVAIVVGGVVALLAHQVFTAVADGAARVTEARIALDREHNGRRILADLVGSLDIGRPGTDGFDGNPDRVTFSTWFLGAQGWAESRRVSMRDSAEALVASGLVETPVALMDSVRAVEFDYLLDYGSDAAWVRTWKSPVSAPLAIRIRVTRVGRGAGDAGPVDTLLLMVGPRG